MNEANVSRELIVTDDGTMYVTVRGADSYELLRAHTVHVGTYRRKWQAIEAARSGEHAHV